jgi:hypothetical protein
MWRPASSKETKEYIKKLNEKCIRYVDVKSFCIDFQGLFTLAKDLIKYSIAFNTVFRSRSDTYIYFLALNQFLLETIYLRNYSCKAVICFDDYMAWHIARTQIYRQYGIRTFGTQHVLGNGLKGMPYIAYVCFDKYLIWGNLYKELFAPFWDDIDTVKFSFNRIDRFLRKWNKKDIDYSNLHSIIPESKRKNILILPPPFTLFIQQHQPRFRGLISFLKNLDHSILKDANIYIRPKRFVNVNQIQQLINNDGVKFVLNDNCTTTELISMADLVISQSGGGVMCECALLRVKVIGYDFFGCLKEFLLQFGDDIYSDSEESLYRIIKAFVNDRPLNINWNLLWDELVYPNAGNTNKIIRNLLDE